MTPSPDMLDFVDVPINHMLTHALCPRCRAIKEIKHFMRRATKAQAKAWGYSGEREIKYESDICLECKPNPKPLHKRTPKEIKTMIENGNIRGSLYEAERTLHRRIKKGKQSMSKAHAKVQQDKAQVRWAHILLSADREANSKYTMLAKAQRERSSMQKIAYLRLCIQMARTYRKLIKDKIRAGVMPPDNLHTWRELINDTDAHTLRQAAHEIPEHELNKMYQGTVINQVEKTSTTATTTM